MFFKTDVNLQSSGGILASQDSTLGPDIYSTFAFVKCYGLRYSSIDIKGKKEYLEMLKVGQVLFKTHFNGQVTLKSVFYGNIIISYEEDDNVID